MSYASSCLNAIRAFTPGCLAQTQAPKILQSALRYLCMRLGAGRGVTIRTRQLTRKTLAASHSRTRKSALASAFTSAAIVLLLSPISATFEARAENYKAPMGQALVTNVQSFAQQGTLPASLFTRTAAEALGGWCSLVV